MKINSYNNSIERENTSIEIHRNIEQKDNSKNKNIEQNKAKEMADRIEISDDALKIASIQSKMKTGFYNDSAIIRETAEKLLKHIDRV